jgi:hypothetical protein
LCINVEHTVQLVLSDRLGVYKVGFNVDKFRVIFDT